MHACDGLRPYADTGILISAMCCLRSINSDKEKAAAIVKELGFFSDKEVTQLRDDMDDT